MGRLFLEERARRDERYVDEEEMERGRAIVGRGRADDGW